MITVIQRAKFFLMRSTVDVVVDRGDEKYVEQDLRESGPIQPAIIEVGGLRLHSDTPKDAAQAARINAAIDRLSSALQPTTP